ncbi:MAG: Sua5/YciO/YrdC/YwlC family protein [Desulfovibrionaceae bacterium]|jgi:L-threonylcarbamoyladenylate synthase|nr:Sua5/YciO/YrdC/YwlC family protein [Desulfovibrionaceae bacterium]
MHSASPGTFPNASPGAFPKALTYAETLAALRRGGVVVYPTGTFYAVGCAYDAPAALARVAALKGRPEGKPFSLLAADRTQLAQLAAPARDAAQAALLDALAARFWPGPLTVVLPARAGLDPHLLAPDGTVAVRVTSHPLAARLARDLGRALVATSANPAGAPPAAEPGRLDAALVAGSDGLLALRPWPCGGVPSTIVAPLDPDAGGASNGLDGPGGSWPGALRLIREGATPVAALRAAGFGVL